MAEQEKQKEETNKDAGVPKEKGFDIAEFLPHLLSALGGIGGSYLLFGKSAQDHIKEIADRMIDMEKKINILWEEREQNNTPKKETLNGNSHKEEDDDDDENFMLSKHQNGKRKRQGKQISQIG